MMHSSRQTVTICVTQAMRFVTSLLIITLRIGYCRGGVCLDVILPYRMAD